MFDTIVFIILYKLFYKIKNILYKPSFIFYCMYEAEPMEGINEVAPMKGITGGAAVDEVNGAASMDLVPGVDANCKLQFELCSFF